MKKIRLLPFPSPFPSFLEISPPSQSDFSDELDYHCLPTSWIDRRIPFLFHLASYSLDWAACGEDAGREAFFLLYFRRKAVGKEASLPSPLPVLVLTTQRQFNLGSPPLLAAARKARTPSHFGIRTPLPFLFLEFLHERDPSLSFLLLRNRRGLFLFLQEPTFFTLILKKGRKDIPFPSLVQ